MSCNRDNGVVVSCSIIITFLELLSNYQLLKELTVSCSRSKIKGIGKLPKSAGFYLLSPYPLNSVVVRQKSKFGYKYILISTIFSTN
jgi:hypothetical protein